ncbi:MAG TPA: type II toxin-antitoxin system RelE/ParE family toxin [Thermoanaerobaculia bacterium]|nr:type II toxin-antitoxin system RelE/ParE family toxin [Thermoanaerobaculia bacterium]
MNFPVRFKASGARDVERAFGWYEAQRKGLGSQFREELNIVLDLIAANPESSPIVRTRIRRAVLRRFPYLVFYLVERQQIVVLACLHASRDPTRWP